jgi:hypothetical protein
MNTPQDKIENYVSDKLQEMYNDIVIDYGLHADDDFEQIIDIIHKQLVDEYGQDDLMEAEYQGRKVQLGKPMAGDVKKSKVYVKGPKGNVVKVNFGDKNMKIKKSNPKRRKSFRTGNGGSDTFQRRTICRSYIRIKSSNDGRSHGRRYQSYYNRSRKLGWKEQYCCTLHKTRTGHAYPSI